MRLQKIIFIGILCLWMGYGLVLASSPQGLQIRFFRGDREGTTEPPEAVTSSYLQPTVTANFQSRFELVEEVAQIKKVFNLKAVDLITEAYFEWGRGMDMIAHAWRLNGKMYWVTLTSYGSKKFQIEIFEQTQDKRTSLLDTEIILPEKNIAVFGFEDLQGKPYFLSFHVPHTAPGEAAGGIAGGVVESGDKKVLENAVRAVDKIKPPRLLKTVQPEYPEIARKGGVEGVVILEAATDEAGDVVWVKVLRSKDKYLTQAAMDAVKQWKYEPFMLDDKPRGVIFTTTVRFKLKEKDFPQKIEGAFRVGEKDKPRLIKEVRPVYPEMARKSGISGAVILEAMTDEKGNVVKVQVIKSESTLLNQAAVDALMQWKYEPFMIDGKPKPVVFTVTVMFRLADKEKKIL